MITYYVEIEGNNCLLTKEAQQQALFIDNDNKKTVSFTQILYIEDDNMPLAAESAIEFIKNNIYLKSLLRNPENNPISLHITEIKESFDNMPPTQNIDDNSFIFYLEEDHYCSSRSQTTPPSVSLHSKCQNERAHFKKLPCGVLEKQREISWLPTLVHHIEQRVDLLFDESDAKKIHAFPRIIQDLYYLWVFQSEVSGGGLEAFVLERCAHEIQGAYQALLSLGDNVLSQSLEHAIAITNQTETCTAEYQDSANDLRWFRQFTDTSIYSDLNSIDKNELTHSHIEQLNDQIIQFIKKNFHHIAHQ